MTLDKRLIFPALLLLLNLGACVACLFSGDYRRAVYWLASGVCIAVVAFK